MWISQVPFLQGIKMRTFLVTANCTTVHNLYRWTALLCTQLYTAVHLDMTYTHLWCTHYAWINCTAVQFYCSPVLVHLYCRTSKFVLTNESLSQITFMNRVDQSQHWFLSVPLPFCPLNCRMLTKYISDFVCYHSAHGTLHSHWPVMTWPMLTYISNWIFFTFTFLALFLLVTTDQAVSQ